jgi:DNA-binding NtrC family response regulator
MRVLIIGTLHGYISEAGKIAINKGAKVTHIDDIESALHLLRSGKGIDLILCDLNLEIKELIYSMERERIYTSVIACGIGTDPKKAADAIRAGAKEYIPLPPDSDLIAAVLEAVCQESDDFFFKDPAMERIVKIAMQVAKSDASVLITGESGTGKEVMAKFIHKNSKRKDRPFISLNCAAIPEGLLESELFGHEKGAFTGAIARRIGKFEEATGGTLLLDEISEMQLHLQSKLLRAIQEREIDRIGGTQSIKIDIRVLATSNRNLIESVKEGSFREDLYYRLNVVNLELPPLRMRPLDIEVLADAFVKKYSKSNNLEEKTLSKESLDLIKAAPWNGNVRELENIMHRAVLMAVDQVITPDVVFPDYENINQNNSLNNLLNKMNSGMSFVGRTVNDVEKELIINTLSHCLGNRTHAANILGISIRTLRNKLKLYAEGLYTEESSFGEH